MDNLQAFQQRMQAFRVLPPEQLFTRLLFEIRAPVSSLVGYTQIIQMQEDATHNAVVPDCIVEISTIAHRMRDAILKEQQQMTVNVQVTQETIRLLFQRIVPIMQELINLVPCIHQAAKVIDAIVPDVASILENNIKYIIVIVLAFSE